MKSFELRRKSPRKHPFEIGNPRSCKELRTRVVSQRMKVNVIEDIGNEISYSLVACVLVSQ